MEIDWTCYEKRTKGVRKHHIYCSTLDTRRKIEERTTQEHLASNRGRRAEDPWPLMGDYDKAGSEQTAVESLRCRPTCQEA